MTDDIMQPPRVILRFENEVVQEAPRDPVELLSKSHPTRFRALQERYGKIRLARSLQQTLPEEIRKLQEQARKRDPGYKPTNFEAFFDISVEKAESLQELAKDLRGWPGLSSVDIEVIGPDPLVFPADDPRFANQGYLTAAPDGIDAPFAWTLPGGDGAGQQVVDVERGWTLNHEDLNAHGASLIHGAIRNGSRSHGTSVLGELCAVDNTIGCVGIAPNVAGVMVSSYWGSTLPDAILAAAAALNFGDTILLEAQTAAQYTPSGDPTYGPIETVDLNFEAIRLAVALGMIVVEAGGNGTNNGGLPALDLDTYIKGGLQILNPASPDFRDSGAIIVAAATSTAPHTRMIWSTFGTRINCYGWGQNVNTTASSSVGSTTAYTSSFAGTSSASPIVTGAALLVQGVFEAQHGFRLSSGQMRGLLSDPMVNTPPSAAETTAMGVMPNLAGILGNLLQLTPDVYLRDFVGDVGEPHGGPISASPDIIVRKTLVANPQAAFGAGSGTENLNNLGHTVEAGQDNYIYIRALNQGNAVANGTNATIYWSPPSTLLTPNLWTLLGTKAVPSLPTGEVLTCADALVWASGDIPATGHYCFIGLLDHPQDLAPPLANFQNWNNFRTFIRSNNNVTWRNFNVVDVDPSAPDVEPLPFLVAGWLNEALPFAVEMRLKMPREVEIILELPLRYLRDMRANLNIVEIDERRQIALAHLPAGGRVYLGHGEIPAKARYDMQLRVKLPKNVEGRIGEVQIRQLFKGEEEVGRISWHFQDIRIRKEQDEKIEGRG